jgi:hypothetical protein
MLPSNTLTQLRSCTSIRFQVARASGPTSIELHGSFERLEQFADDLINFENILCQHTQRHTRSPLRQGHLNFVDCGYLSFMLPPPNPAMGLLQQKVHTAVNSLQLVELNLDVSWDDGFMQTISGWLCLPVLKKLRLFYDVDLVGIQSLPNDFTNVVNLKEGLPDLDNEDSDNCDGSGASEDDGANYDDSNGNDDSYDDRCTNSSGDNNCDSDDDDGVDSIVPIDLADPLAPWRPFPWETHQWLKGLSQMISLEMLSVRTSLPIVPIRHIEAGESSMVKLWASCLPSVDRIYLSHSYDERLNVCSDIIGRLELYLRREGNWLHYPLFRDFDQLPLEVYSMVDADQELETHGRLAEAYFMFGG